MKKKALVQKIIDTLLQEVALYEKAARAARAEATHDQSKAENKYDTRGLEASYLARGQSRQAAELEQTLELFQKMTPKDFSATDPIDLGAWIHLEGRTEDAFYFMAQRGGGTEIVHDKKEVMVITPQSPIGEQLLGKKEGQKIEISLGNQKTSYVIKKVA
ncbi:MAG: GreA/GreB family elongation factor [Verrucomicrobiales bacterium]